MSKNKRSKIIQLKPTRLSSEKYIKTQARSLPIAECLINSDWESTGISSIIIARRHKTGNMTVGLYLTDLFCLGLKDAQYRFNLSPEDYSDFKDIYPDWKQCDYTLAHNLIYGAIAFAEDYGFKPCKEFFVAQFILDEDDENVELLEIEFGLDGKPFYMTGPYDDKVKIASIINTLTRTAGPGNFTIVNDEEDFNHDKLDVD